MAWGRKEGGTVCHGGSASILKMGELNSLRQREKKKRVAGGSVAKYISFFGGKGGPDDYLIWERGGNQTGPLPIFIAQKGKRACRTERRPVRKEERKIVSRERGPPRQHRALTRKGENQHRLAERKSSLNKKRRTSDARERGGRVKPQ